MEDLSPKNTNSEISSKILPLLEKTVKIQTHLEHLSKTVRELSELLRDNKGIVSRLAVVEKDLLDLDKLIREQLIPSLDKKQDKETIEEIRLKSKANVRMAVIGIASGLVSLLIQVIEKLLKK